MVESDRASIRIDLNQFKLHINIPSRLDVSLHFTSPSRKFYLSVIALLVHEMKKQGRITSIPLGEHYRILALLNETVGGAAGSSNSQQLIPRIYRKWKDALPNLEHAPLFRVLGRSREYEDAVGKTYPFTDEEKDLWANLFEYTGSREHVRLRFSVDKLGATLEDVSIVYGDDPNLGDADAWGEFIGGLKRGMEEGNEWIAAQTDKVDSISPGTIPHKRPLLSWRQWIALACLMGFIVASALVVSWHVFFRAPPSGLELLPTDESPLPLTEKPSIAVLPFVNMSGDPEQEYFSDGIAEEIITALSKTSKLFVIARDSTFAYKDKPLKVQQVAEELGVQYVLGGSVRKSEDRVRIAAQLIDARTGHHLWAERYDRTVKDILAVQEEITKDIITALQVELTEGEQARVYAKGTDNLEAYLKVMEATWLGQQSTKEGALKARQLVEQAIALDSDYALAYNVLGYTHILDIWLGLSKSPEESVKRASELHKKAIAMDSSLAQAHASLGYSLVMARQYDQAIAEGEEALALEPNSAGIVYRYAVILTWAGRYKEAIPFFREALRLNPKPPNTYYRHLGVALGESGRYEEAIALQKKAIKQDRNDIFAYLVLAALCSLAGREQEARAAAEEVLRIDPRFSVARMETARPDKDRAVAKRWNDALRKAGLPD
jgi:TolB-like protein/Tfp pilus assembly protein PilF